MVQNAAFSHYYSLCLFFQLHISVRCEISRSLAMWGTLQWFCAKWRRANQSRAPGTGTGQMVQTRWVNCSEHMVFLVLREICDLWIETSTFILLLHSVIESLEHKWFDLKPKHTCGVNTQVFSPHEIFSMPCEMGELLSLWVKCVVFRGF